jgi:hypothetical protein
MFFFFVYLIPCSYFETDVTTQQLELKERLCRELLELLERLGAGECRMRGRYMEKRVWEKDCVKEAINKVCRSKKQARQYTYRITLRRVLVIIFAVEWQTVSKIMSVSVGFTLS